MKGILFNLKAKLSKSNLKNIATMFLSDMLNFITMSMNIDIKRKKFKAIVFAVVFILFSFFSNRLLLIPIANQSAIAAPARTSAPSAELGTIMGEFAVNGNGGATYTIPLEVPPGTNGVQPNLSLVYNSQQENGLLGMGWQLAGFSAISRCGKTLATDGVKGGVNFDAEDRFCWDGQRLIASEGVYGEEGTEYHTERESWVKVISHTTAGQNGPQWFSATTKDGYQMEFGNSEDSQISAGLGDGAVRVWAVSKVSDRNGNTVEASYQQDSSAQQCNATKARDSVAQRSGRAISGSFLGYFPTEIRYTGNSISGAKPQRLVTFEYECRNDNVLVYVGGAQAETTKRLSHLKTYVALDGESQNLATQKNLVKEYRLSYQYGEGTGLSHLTELQECDSAGACLPETLLTYQSGRQSFDDSNLWNEEFGNDSQGHSWKWSLEDHIRTTADVNGDGYSDIVGFGEDGVYVALSNKTSSEPFGPAAPWIKHFGHDNNSGEDNINNGEWDIADNPRFMADVNGDGLADIVGFGDYGVYVSLSEGTDFAEPKMWINEFGKYNEGINRNGWDSKYLRFMADLDGDGRSDVVGFGDYGVYVAISNGRDRFEDEYLDEKWIEAFGCETRGDSTRDDGWCVDNKNYLRTMADINGDGLLDIVGFGEDGVYAALSDGQEFIDYKRWTNYFGWSDNAGGWKDVDYIRTLADVNGDGLSDIIGFGEKGVEVSLSDGVSFKTPTVWNDYFGSNDSHGDWSTSDDLRIMADVNGDGFSDIVGFGNSGIEVSLSDGATQFIDYEQWSDEFTDASNSEWRSDNSIRMMADVDGDGQADIVGFGDDGVDVALSLEKAELVTQIEDGLGQVISIEYEPLTEPSIYTKGSGASYPKVDVQLPVYVVSQYEIAESAANPTNSVVYRQEYEGAKIDRYRGWIGFEKIYLFDEKNNTKTTTTYRTDFPLLGMVSKREIEDRNTNQVLGKMLSEYDYSESDGIYKFWQDSVTLDRYTSGSSNYRLQRTYAYDPDHQNVTMISDLGDVEDPNDDVYTCLDYADGTGENWWHSFFPTDQKVVSEETGCNALSTWNAATDLRWDRSGYDERMNLNSQSKWLDRNGPDLVTTNAKKSTSPSSLWWPLSWIQSFFRGFQSSSSNTVSDAIANQWLTVDIDYDTYGNVTSFTDPLGNITSIRYDDTYNTFPERLVTPEAEHGSLTVSASYEPKFGTRIQFVDPNDNVVMNIAEDGIDGFGRVVAMQGIQPDSDSLATLFKRDLLNLGDELSVKTWYQTQWEGDEIPNEETWLWEQDYIDGLGRIYKSEEKGYNNETIASKVEFNDIGEIAKEFLPYYLGGDAIFTSYQYNVRGNVTEMTNPLGAISRAAYDVGGDARHITYSLPAPSDDVGGNSLVEIQIQDTSRGWLKEKVAPDESQVSYTYDRLGQVTKIIDPLGQETDIVYNSLGEVISETTRETGTTEYYYNENGELTSQIDAKGQKIGFEYDALNRIIEKQIYDNSDAPPTQAIAYEYDNPSVDNGKGELTSIIMPEATYTFSYDNLGQLKQGNVEIDTDGNGGYETYTSQYTYDAAGRPDEITYPDGSIVRYIYDEGGYLQSVDFKEAGNNEFETYAAYEDYNAFGEIGKTIYNNQAESTYTYDEIGRITNSTAKVGTQTFFDFSYTWNKADKLLSIEDNTDRLYTQRFDYDLVGRLNQAIYDNYGDEGDSLEQNYQYDAAGNIIEHEIDTALGKEYEYDEDKRHQLTGVYDSNHSPIAELIYDANGNTTQYGPWAYTYDAENRLIQVDKDSSGKVNEFTYDESGDRLSKIETDGTVTYYISPLYEVVRNADGSQVHTKYINGPEGTIATISKDGDEVSLIAAIQGNSINLEAQLYDSHSWSGLTRILLAQFNQFAFTHRVGPVFGVGLLVVCLLLALSIWMYCFWISASRESWLGKTRALAARIALGLGWITPESANLWIAPQPKGWLLQTQHRPISFILALVAFSWIGLSGPSLLAAELPAGQGLTRAILGENPLIKNGDGYPVAGKVLYFQSDRLGSTALVTDADGNFVNQTIYDPYGEVGAYGGENISRPKFTGKEFDNNSELYYFGARYYEPFISRFLTPDPARQYSSPYVYGNGDPLSGIDPDGEQFVTIAIIAASAVATSYMAGATVNNTYNPVSWDWNSGKTWAAVVGGAALGAAAAGVGMAAGSAAASAGLSSTTVVATEIAVDSVMGGIVDASFTAMAGGNMADVGRAFGRGFAGDLFSTPGSGATKRTRKGGQTTSQRRTIRDTGGGSCSRSSFAAGTEVATADGEKAIESIAVEDLVLAYNEETGEVGEYPVTQLFSRIAPESVVVTVGEEAIVTTPEHEFYTANGWVEAEDLKIGDTLVRLGGKEATVTDLKPHQDSTRVYNFEVDEAHTYYVSEQFVLVHNPTPCVSFEPGNPNSMGLTSDTNRTLYAQPPNSMDCVATSCAMVLDTLGKQVDIKNIKAHLNARPTGANMSDALRALQAHGISNAKIAKQVEPDQLRNATAQGHPVIAHLQVTRYLADGSSRTAGHAVVVDGFRTINNDDYVDIRDPAGGRAFLAPFQEFWGLFQKRAIFTN